MSGSRRVEMVIYFAFVAAAAGTVVGTVAWLGWYRRRFDEMTVSLIFSSIAALPGVALAVESFVRGFLLRDAPIVGGRHPPEPFEWTTTLISLLWIFVGFMSLLFATYCREKPVPWRANALQAVHVVTWFLACITAFMFAMTV